MGWFRELRRKIRERLFGRPDFRPMIHEGLAKLHGVLRDTPLLDRIWINGGVLLGLAREGGILRHDTDADFSIWREDVPHLMAIVPRLKEAGIVPENRWMNNAGEATEWSFKYRAIKLEFFEMRRRDDTIQWFCYGDKPVREFLCETPLHGLKDVRLGDRNWKIPDDPDRYLTSLYGDWRTPNSSYSYYRDSRAIVRRSPWKGEKSW